MATDNNNSVGASNGSPGATGQPADLGIVSVNSRGGSSSNILPKVIFVVLLLAIVLVGGLFAVNKWRAFSNARDAAASKDDKNENRPAMVGLRRKFDSDPQFAENAPKIDAKGGPCDDGTPGVVLVGPDGNAMLAPSGQAMRVCKDGRVISPGGPAKVVPEVKGGQQTQGQGQTAPPPSRYAGDVIVPAPTKALPGSAAGGPSERSMQTLAMVQDILGKTTGQQAAGGLGGAPGSTVNLGGAGAGSGGGAASSPQGSIGSLLTPSSTPMVQAGMLGDRSMILPKGRTIDCGLSMRLVNEVAGMATCVISSDVYSDNGRVLLLERGSEATGEYMSAMQQGQKRIFVLWSRVKTPHGVVMNLNSPAADSLGTSGLDGYVDNHWFERIGAAVMLSLVQDAIAYKTAEASGTSGTGNTQAQGGTVVLQNSQQTGSSLAEKILASTINIKPTLYKNQGDRASIFVARDLDFGTVYALRPR